MKFSLIPFPSINTFDHQRMKRAKIRVKNSESRAIPVKWAQRPIAGDLRRESATSSARFTLPDCAAPPPFARPTLRFDSLESHHSTSDPLSMTFRFTRRREQDEEDELRRPKRTLEVRRGRLSEI